MSMPARFSSDTFDEGVRPGSRGAGAAVVFVTAAVSVVGESAGPLPVSADAGAVVTGVPPGAAEPPGPAQPASTTAVTVAAAPANNCLAKRDMADSSVLVSGEHHGHE
jgi:hypothetical protein